MTIKQTILVMKNAISLEVTVTPKPMEANIARPVKHKPKNIKKRNTNLNQNERISSLSSGTDSRPPL